MTRQGGLLAALALLRSARTHKVRSAAAIIAGTVGVCLTTAALVIIFAVTNSIAAVPLEGAPRAQWAIQARSSSGLDVRVLRQLERALSDADLAPLTLVNTRLAEEDRHPVLVVGFTADIASFLSQRDRQVLVDSIDPGAISARDVYLARPWAQQRGISEGSKISLVAPGGTVEWTVRGLVDGEFANQGAVAIAPMLPVADAFGRRGVVDLVLAKGRGSQELLRDRLQDVVGGAASVVRPDETTASYNRAFSSVRNLLMIFVAVSIMASAAIVFFCWRVTLEDSRPHFARLRLSGATSRHLALGSGLALGGVFIISAVVGTGLGLMLGASLSRFTEDLIRLTQLSAEIEQPVASATVGGLLAGAVVFTAAWASSLSSFIRMPVIEAVGGRRAVRAGLGIRAPIVVAGLAGLLAALLGLRPGTMRGLAFLPLLVVVIALSLVLPAAAGALVRRRGGFANLAAGRELTRNRRRTGALVSIFALAIAMSLGLHGVATSLQRGMARGVEAWTRGDLFVQTAPSGGNLQEDKFAPAAAETIRQLPGVAAVSYFTYSTVALNGTRIQLWTWGEEARSRFVDLEVSEGTPTDSALWEMLDDSHVAVSSNFARLNNVRVGESVRIPTALGAKEFAVAAIVDDLTSPAGVIIMAPSVYTDVTRDHRRYQLIVGTDPGARVRDVAASIREELGENYPSLVVYDRAQIRQRFATLTGRILQSFQVFALSMFLLALLIGAATLATTLTLRRPALALERLSGASTRLLRSQLTTEAIVLGASSWVIAAPIGFLLVYALIDLVAAQTGLLPAVVPPAAFAALSLPAAVVLAVLSLLLLGPRAVTPVMPVVLAEE